MESSYVGVCDENVCGRWDRGDDSPGDVRNEVKSTMDGFLSKDGYFEDVWIHEGEDDDVVESGRTKL